jgi:hypothetical protein
MLGRNFLRGRVQLPRSAVVSEPLPQPQHLGFLGGREPMYVRERLRKPREVVANRGHLRLLQHDLADPHPIRIARLSPRKIARVLGIPRQQSTTQRLLLGR